MPKSSSGIVSGSKPERTKSTSASKKPKSAMPQPSAPTLGVGQERITEAKAEYSRLLKVRLTRQAARQPLSPQLRHQIMQRDDFRCVFCGADSTSGTELEIDHKVPISRGGTNDPHNLQTLCRACNLGKSNHLF